MGISATAQLVYGYNLGGGEIDWLVEEATGEYGALHLDWYDEQDDVEEVGDFVDVAMRRLLASVGFTETDWRAAGYHERKKEAQQRLGVTFETYCSSEFPIYVLTAHTITAAQGHAQTMDMAALQRQPTENRWDAQLDTALQTLGLTPTQPRPAWLLCSWQG
ncbi:hypothetical protein [Spirillospora sp. CA-294931]|uniref:hypothetical protein n=1 Tax=Spirillospora sp. CA-294931 TaxID=3240042 RepID=UPI003D93AB04